MQGYTKRSAKQTIEEMKLFHDQMFSFVQGIIESWDGIMVKSLGDGFMVRFDSPTKAIQAGIEVQKKLETRNAQMLNPDSIVRFRIGINTGEVGIDENGDLFGDPVNIAARIQTFADSNDVYIAESTYLAMNRNEFGAVDLGNQELKNATREIKIYKILRDGSPGVTLKDTDNSAQVSLAEQTGKKFNYSVFAGIASVVIISLLLGFFIGHKRGKAKQKAFSSTQKQKNISDKTGGGKGKTLLDMDSTDSRLPFKEGDRRLMARVQSLCKKGDFAEASKRLQKRLNSVKGSKKLPWALMLSEVYWNGGQRDKAESMFKTMTDRVRQKPKLQKMILDKIELIKNK